MELVLKGAMVAGGMIVSIGSQNTFVLKHGLRRQHVFWIAATCFLCDVVLMSAGVYGLGHAIGTSRLMTLLLALGGVLFMGWYGWCALRSALRRSGGIEVSERDSVVTCDTLPVNIGRSILATLLITLVNPQVYLDTVVIVGGVAGTLDHPQKADFLAGALLASLGWFFALGYGARWLQPWFRDARTWRVLDGLTGLMMWWTAARLLGACLGA